MKPPRAAPSFEALVREAREILEQYRADCARGVMELLRESSPSALAYARVFGGEAGEEAVRKVLLRTAIGMIRRGEPLPLELRAYVCEVLRAQIPPTAGVRFRERSGRPYAKGTRDWIITCTVDWIIKRHGLPPHRNPTTKRPSACTVVARALGAFGINLSEAAVERIWRFEHYWASRRKAGRGVGN